MARGGPGCKWVTGGAQTHNHLSTVRCSRHLSYGHISLGRLLADRANRNAWGERGELDPSSLGSQPSTLPLSYAHHVGATGGTRTLMNQPHKLGAYRLPSAAIMIVKVRW